MVLFVLIDESCCRVVSEALCLDRCRMLYFLKVNFTDPVELEEDLETLKGLLHYSKGTL